MLKLKNKSVTPPDLYTWVCPQDGFTIRAYDHGGWYDQIKQYAKNNDYPIPTIEDCDDQLCRRLDGEWCESDNPNVFFKTRFKISEVIQSAKVVITGTIVDEATATERARICSMCFANVNAPGCQGCSGLSNLIAGLKGAKKTKYDHLLKICGICRCPNEAQVWYSDEDLRKTITPETAATYQTVEHCWKRSLCES